MIFKSVLIIVRDITHVMQNIVLGNFDWISKLCLNGRYLVNVWSVNMLQFWQAWRYFLRYMTLCVTSGYQSCKDNNNNLLSCYNNNHF